MSKGGKALFLYFFRGIALFYILSIGNIGIVLKGTYLAFLAKVIIKVTQILVPVGPLPVPTYVL